MKTSFYLKYILFSVFVLVSYEIKAQTDHHLTMKVFTKELKDKIPSFLEEMKVPGLAIAIIDDGKVIYESGHGWADVNFKKKVTSKTGFNIGSISKMFTAWGVMKLVNEGKVGLDDQVEKYLTRWSLPNSEFDKSKVTIRNLLSHTAGLSVHGYSGYAPDAELPTIEASLAGEVRDKEKVMLIMEPQTKWKYSGGGYTVLQLLIEEVTGKPFAIYMKDEIFSPLHMKHTSFIITDEILKESSKAYDEEGKEIYLERFTAQAAAGLHTTLEDLLFFANASLDGNTVLSTETIRQMTKPVSLSEGKYGLGYMNYPVGKKGVIGHAGSNDGWQSGFMLDFGSNSGIIMLSNGSSGKSVLLRILKEWATWKFDL